MDESPYWEQPTWRAALSDTNRAARTVRFWMAEAVVVAIGAVLAVPLYPDGASAFEQAGISSAAIVAATLGLVIVIFLGKWVAFSARGQRDEAGKEVERLQAHQDWRTIINHITDFAREGNSAMEAYGRPGHVVTERGLEFINGWISRVRDMLPYEYYVDFESEGRAIYKGDEIWVEQLDIRLTRLREIAADIRNRHL